MWDGSAITWDYGPAGQASKVRWEHLGYCTRLRILNATDIGGSISQRRLVVTRTRIASNVADILWIEGDRETSRKDGSSSRPMSNLLTPEGLICNRHRSRMGTSQLGIDCHTEPMPPYQAWIKTSFGVRRLLLEELARGLGLEKKRLKELITRLTPTVLQRTTSIYHWEHLAAGLVQVKPSNLDQAVDPSSEPDAAIRLQKQEPLTFLPFSWAPPDLAIGGDWYRARLQNLMIASSTYDDVYGKLREGIQMLTVHRSNYTSTHAEPKELQILWWEFPSDHWDDLREGSNMNFLSPPPTGLIPNGMMTDEQGRIAGEFVDELVALKVLQEPPPGRATECNAPLFLVPKEGQPGQWRCIANLLEGGQNSVVGNDPVFLPRVSHILPRCIREDTAP